MFNEDYKDMLSLLLANRVKFLVVGAYALGAYGFPRATGDADIWVECSKENSMRIYDFFDSIRGTYFLLNSSNVCGAGDCVSDWSSPQAIWLSHQD